MAKGRGRLGPVGRNREKPNKMSNPGEITQLLDQLDQERGAAKEAILEQIMPLVYGELKALARGNRYRWDGFRSPGTTSLVHEAYLKLSDQSQFGFANRRHFFSVASKAMRCILIDNARWHGRQKRGGGGAQETLRETMLVSAERSEELLALDEALGLLSEKEPRLASIVECRCFGGLTVEETAEALAVSPATVKRGWSLARAWLFRQLRVASN
jgi:RNA polymerase sigma factor (TIGR02999 family)